MSFRRLPLLRPLAFVAATAALGAFWWWYYHSPELVIDSFPPRAKYDLNSWLRPLYAIPRLPPEIINDAPLARPAMVIDESPVFDRLALAVVLAISLTLLTATAVVRRWWTPVCLAIATISVLLINVFVARIPDGDFSFLQPFTRVGLEYYTDVPLVKDDPIAFIHDYPSLNHRPTRYPIDGMSHHAGTHPPGGVLFQYFGQRWFAPPPAPAPKPRAQPSLFDSFFGGGSRPPIEDNATRMAQAERARQSLNVAAWWAVAVTALAVLPAWWLARSVGGAAAARRMLPLFLCTPNLVLYGATSMDGVFLTVTLTAMAAGVAAIRRDWSWLWTPLLTLIAGVAMWSASFITFASVAVPLLMGLYALFVTIRRPWRGGMMFARCAMIGAVWIFCQLAAQHWLKYDLGATLHAAIERDAEGLAIRHTGGYDNWTIWQQVSLANLLAWMVGSGVAITGLALVALAVAIGSGRLRHGPAATFAPAVALAMLILSCSTLFTFETERVWLFMTPALLVVAATQFRGAVVWTLLLAASFAQVFWMETQYYVYW